MYILYIKGMAWSNDHYMSVDVKDVNLKVSHGSRQLCKLFRLRHPIAHAWLGSQAGETNLPSLKCSCQWKGCSHRGQYFARGIQGLRSQAFFAFTSDGRHMQMHSRAQKL